MSSSLSNYEQLQLINGFWIEKMRLILRKNIKLIKKLILAFQTFVFIARSNTSGQKPVTAQSITPHTTRKFAKFKLGGFLTYFSK